MASTPFNVISWAPNDPITDEKLDAMVSNDGWLRDNMLMGRYRANNVTRDIGIKIASGVVTFTKGKNLSRETNVNFDGFFSQGCQPIVTTGILSSSHRSVFVTLTGPGTQAFPNRDGFKVQLNVSVKKNAPNKINRNIYVSWHALGW